MTHAAAEITAPRALFARVLCKANPAIVPLSEGALGPHSEGPALFCIHSIVGVGVTDFLPLARNFGEVGADVSPSTRRGR